ncbi:hypothetical protein Q0Z83_054100 [Actinoplanes sichuanensis]|uniref:ISAs1 family transposase n=1 Tax=Actinoplanes sichuanensis TaxID=512349 RepID=A0ABW4ARW3_9ACTN|nr:hypothetical protein Q0Z83_054100 [Actinoplanes sichuanensis]
MAGASSFASIADWLYDLDDQARARFGFGNGVPAGTTMWRLLIRLDPTLLTSVLAGWLHSMTRPLGLSPRRYRRVIAIDGKTLRGARLRDGRQVHLLSALDTTTGIVIAQVTVDTKSNEITSFAPLLDAVEKVLGTLAGVLFMADALHSQTDHADEVTARHAHLLVQVKGNQPALFKQLKQLPGHRSRSVTGPVTAGTDAARPALSKPSLSARPAVSPSTRAAGRPGSPDPHRRW